jgi:hypothetical protein
LADALERLLVDAPRRCRLGEAARSRMVEEGRPAEHAAALIAVYERARAQRPG